MSPTTLRFPLLRRARVACAVSICTLALGACGGGGTDDAPAGSGGNAGAEPAPPSSGMPGQVSGSDRSTVRYGQIVISETSGEQSGAVSRVAARFVRLTRDAATRVALLERAGDACTRVPDDLPVPGQHDDPARPPGSELAVGGDLAGEDLDAGQAIVLSSADGTWSTLVPTLLGTAHVYLNDSEGSRIDGRIPSGLVIDIPDGGDFPGFTAIALPDPQPAADSFVPATGSGVTNDTAYRWAPSNATGSRVHLAIRDARGRLDCFAVDDGLFTLADASPDSDALGTGATLAGVAREAIRIERRDDAVLVMTTATERP